MTELLQRAFEEASKLPPDQQAIIADSILRFTQSENGLIAYTESELDQLSGLTPELKQKLSHQIEQDEI